jgi:hypothetical protein
MLGIFLRHSALFSYSTTRLFDLMAVEKTVLPATGSVPMPWYSGAIVAYLVHRVRTLSNF